MTEERMIRVNTGQWQDLFDEKKLSWNELSMILFGPEFELETPSFYDLEPAPPKDWAQQMKDLEERNIRLSRFILDWLGRELDIFPEGALSLDDILPTSDNRRGNTARK